MYKAGCHQLGNMLMDVMNMVLYTKFAIASFGSVFGEIINT
jgi:hypothetical protein